MSSAQQSKCQGNFALALDGLCSCGQGCAIHKVIEQHLITISCKQEKRRIVYAARGLLGGSAPNDSLGVLF